MRPSLKLTGRGLAALGAIMLAVFSAEGGFVDHPNDPGGATNHGVTEKVARQHGWTGSMRALPKRCAGPDDICADSILVADYVEKPGFVPLVEIEPAVAEEVIDSAVNFGPRRPSLWLQRNLNELGNLKGDARLAVDGMVGPATIAAFERYTRAQGSIGCAAMLDAMDYRQAEEYRRLVQVNPKLRVFLKGWMRVRVGNVDRGKCLRRWWETAA